MVPKGQSRNDYLIQRSKDLRVEDKHGAVSSPVILNLLSGDE